MVGVISDSAEEGRDNLMPGLAGAAGYGLGSAFLGPGLGMPIGGTVAGAYIGGMEGTVLTVTGMALGLASLVFGNPLRRRVSGTSNNGQGVK